MCDKCGQQDPDHLINECELLNKCANYGGEHPVYAGSCISRKLEKEILAIKHKNYIPYHEARKMVKGSKTAAYSYEVQRGKAPHKKYEEIGKTLIRLEPGKWENFINKINKSLA